MEKEIKFRYSIKLTSGEVKQEVITLKQLESSSSLHEIIRGAYQRDNKGSWLKYHDYTIIARDRFTGLQTKSKKDIYESDILGGYPHGTVQVKWNDEWGCFEAHSTEWNYDTEDGEPQEVENGSLLANDLKDCFDEWDVLGNIQPNATKN